MHKNATEKEGERERESFAARAHALALANGLFNNKREIWKKRREKKERCA